MEDLNPADTAARYPDAAEIELADLAEVLDHVEELLTWIQTQLRE